MSSGTPGNNPQLHVSSPTQTNVGMDFSTKGTGVYRFQTFLGGSWLEIENLTDTPTLRAASGSPDANLRFETQGTGDFIFKPNGGNPSAGLLSVDGSGNLLFDTTLVAADIPVDLEVNSLSVSATGSGINFFDTFDNQMFEMDRGGSPAVNWFNTRSSIAGVNPVFTVNGSDTNIGMRFATKGSGTFQLFPGNVAGAVGPLGLDASGNITFDSLTLTDADIPNELTIRILTGTSATPSGADIQINDAIGNEVFDMKRAGSAVNYVRLWNAGTGAAPFFEVLGEDTDIDFELHAKGTGAVRIVSSDFVVDADGLFDGSIILTDAATDPKAVYWGDPSTNGSWRIILISGTLHSQKLIAGTWTDEAIDGTP